jgi:hypothetical protein
MSATLEQSRAAPTAMKAVVPVEGPVWLASHSALLATLPSTAVLAINLGTGEHVVGTSGLEAMDLFEARFGTSAKAWLHRMAGPIRL